MTLTPRNAFLAKIYLLGGSILAITLISTWYNVSLGSAGSSRPFWRMCAVTAPTQKTLPESYTTPHKRHRIAIASNFGFHYDVYLALAWTLQRVMKDSSGSVEVYANQPFNFQFQEIVDNLGLYHGVVHHPDDLIRDVARDAGEDTIDMVVLGTCEIDMRGDWHPKLLAAWDARGETQKFQLVCIVHNVGDTGWQSSIPEWSRRNAIRLLTISEHVAKSFRRSFNQIADSPDPILWSAGYEHIPIDVHVPILDIPNLPELSPRRILSKAVIQGSFSVDRRDYIHIFEELITSLSQDPEAWGYLPIGDQPSYTVDTSLPEPPFRLYLVGSGYLDIPLELKNVIVTSVDLNYTEFYILMSSMDLCIPAFSTKDNGYYERQASSTFAMALECNVPILVTQRMREAYTYADDDRIVITRPAAIREVAALRALRTMNASDFLDGDISQSGVSMGYNLNVRKGVQAMMDHGWTRQKSQSQSFKEDIWKANDQVVERLLRDL